MIGVYPNLFHIFGAEGGQPAPHTLSIVSHLLIPDRHRYIQSVSFYSVLAGSLAQHVTSQQMRILVIELWIENVYSTVLVARTQLYRHTLLTYRFHILKFVTISFNQSIGWLCYAYFWILFSDIFLCFPAGPNHTAAVIAAILLLLLLAIAAVVYCRCHLNIKLWYKNFYAECYGDNELNGEASEVI